MVSDPGAFGFSSQAHPTNLSPDQIASRLAGSACPRDTAFLTDLISDLQTPITTDMYFHSMKVTLEVVAGVPIISILAGKVRITSSDINIDLSPVKLSPVIDASLCGLRPFEFDLDLPGALTIPNVQFDVTFNDLAGSLRLATSRKTAAENRDSARRATATTDIPTYYIDTFVLRGTATLPFEATNAVMATTYLGKIDDYAVSIDFGTHDGGAENGAGVVEFTLDKVNVDFGLLVEERDCGNRLPSLIDDFDHANGAMTLTFNSVTGLKVTGSVNLVDGSPTFDKVGSVSPFLEYNSPMACKDGDPKFKFLAPSGASTTLNSAAARTMSRITTFKLPAPGAASAAPTVSKTERILIPARGSPVEVEVDENGDGVVPEPWNIFGRPKIVVPPFVAEVSIKSQVTLDADITDPYEIDKIGSRKKLYNDR